MNTRVRKYHAPYVLYSFSVTIRLRYGIRSVIGGTALHGNDQRINNIFSFELKTAEGIRSHNPDEKSENNDDR